MRDRRGVAVRWATVHTGLVLGGGGASGWLFHTGVVDTLTRAGYHPSGVLVVGTSAGAAVGAAWKVGSDSVAIRALIDREPTDEEREAMRESRGDDERTARFRPLEPGLAVRAWRAGGGIGSAVAGLLPAGRFPTTAFGRISYDEGVWPEGLWITATAVDRGGAVVFGRDVVDVALGDAVEASVAMPGVLRPKEIGGRRYLDGGAVSPTHADLLVDSGVDLAIVSSPMSGRATALGRFARRRLTSELTELDRAGIPYLLVQPPETLREEFAAYPRRDRRVGDVLVAAGREGMATALA